MRVEPLNPTQARRAEAILRALPEWFGIEASLVEYVARTQSLPTLLEHHSDGSIAGFLSLEQHSPQAAEIHVMAIDPRWHRRGIGQRLVARAERWCALRGVRFLQVKTLAAQHEDPFYARTRAFYEAQGFCLLEVFETLWGASNPCAQYVKAVDPDAASESV